MDKMRPSALGRILQHRMVAAWLVWAFAMMSNALVGVTVQVLVEGTNFTAYPPLLDVGFAVLPYIPSKSVGFSIPDLCSLGSATLIAVGIVFQFDPSSACILLRRVLLISGIAYLGRTFSVPLTLLPNPDAGCRAALHPDSFLLSVLLVPFGSTVTCADVFYSGHTIPITCALLVWKDYMRYSRVRVLGFIISTAALFGIIATHFHYTVDVFYGVVVTLVVWRMYHFALRCPSILFHLPWLVWWEQDGALGHTPVRVPAGVLPLDLSSDPRLTWSWKARQLKPKISGLSRPQVLLLLVVTLTLSPSWFALWNTAQSLP